MRHGSRYFAFVPDPYAAVAINVVHGICYAFFFATLYIFVDAVFPKDARTSAQGLFNLLVFGLVRLPHASFGHTCKTATKQ